MCASGVGKEQAEKTREVGWGKGEDSNWIPGSSAPQWPTLLGETLGITCQAFAVFSLRKAPTVESSGMDERKTFSYSLIVECWGPHGDKVVSIVFGRGVDAFFATSRKL